MCTFVCVCTRMFAVSQDSIHLLLFSVFFFKVYFDMYGYVLAWVYMHHVHGGVSEDPLELELQVVVGQLIGVLGTNLKSSVRAVSAFNP